MNDRQTGQVYSCAECGFKSYHKSDWVRMLFLVLHTYTQHLHADEGLSVECSKVLLRECRLYGWWDVSQPSLN